MTTIEWEPSPEVHDYPAALSYLSLVLGEQQAETVVAELRAAPDVWFKAKDILRASGLPELDSLNRHVLIADGYHRVCAVYHFNEDANVPCRIV